jgi:hypothetical protein
MGRLSLPLLRILNPYMVPKMLQDFENVRYLLFTLLFPLNLKDSCSGEVWREFLYSVYEIVDRAGSYYVREVGFYAVIVCRLPLS